VVNRSAANGPNHQPDGGTGKHDSTSFENHVVDALWTANPTPCGEDEHEHTSADCQIAAV